MKFARVLLPAVVFLPLFALSQTKHYEAPAFSADFPNPPSATEVKYEDQKLSLKGGGESTLYEYSVSTDNDSVAYMFMYNDYPPNSCNDRSACLDNVMNGALSGHDNRTNFKRWSCHVDNLPANCFTFTDPGKWSYSVRDAVRYNNGTARLYQLIYVNSEPDFEKAEAYFDSVKVK